MSSEWLTAESFERNHRLISAINTLSIYTKLLRSGVSPMPDIGDVAAARTEIRMFLGRMGPLVQEAEADANAPMLGTDARLSLLVRQFATTRRQRPSSILHRTPIEQVSSLLESARPADQDRLIDYLRALRQLVEQHTHEDVVGLLGEV
jgi:hypothetical protein